MPNNYLSVLYKHIIQVENKNVGLKVVVVCVGETNIPLPPPPPPITTYLSINVHRLILNIQKVFIYKCS